MPLVQVDLFNRAKQTKEPYFKKEKTEYQKFFPVVIMHLQEYLCYYRWVKFVISYHHFTYYDDSLARVGT